VPLIVLEGAEGVGKTTQVAKLAERLTGKVLSLREPGGTPLGEVLRNAVLHSDLEIAPAAESLIFMAARAQLVASEINPALSKGATVLLDRFFLSTYAYQVAGRGVSATDVVAANHLATGGLRPDLTLLLTLPTDIGLARAKSRSGHDRIERADAAFHGRVAGAFAEFATAVWQKSHPEAGPVVAIDASGSESEVHARVVAAVRAALPSSIR
jgi:dTMP kinase